MTTKILLIAFLVTTLCFTVVVDSASAGSRAESGRTSVSLTIGIGSFDSVFFSTRYDCRLSPRFSRHPEQPVYYSPVIIYPGFRSVYPGFRRVHASQPYHRPSGNRKKYQPCGNPDFPRGHGRR